MSNNDSSKNVFTGMSLVFFWVIAFVGLIYIIDLLSHLFKFIAGNS